MSRSRNDGVVVRGAGVFLVALLLGAPLIGSCGGTSRGGAGSASGGVGGGAGTLTGGAHSAGGASGNGGAQAGGTQAGGGQAGGMQTGGVQAGGRNAAGDAGSGGAIEAGGEGPAGGAAGHDDGWPCGDQRCSVGQSCIRCLIQNQTPQRCVPSPDQDPTGYASATAACEAPPFGREDCNGPEDCQASQYCVAHEGARCQNQASTEHFCCFACDAITNCTLCHTDQDCPNGETCEPNEVADSKGCRAAH